MFSLPLAKVLELSNKAEIIHARLRCTYKRSLRRNGIPFHNEMHTADLARLHLILVRRGPNPTTTI